MVHRPRAGGEVTSGFWPRLADELQSIPRRIADYFAPESDASATPEFYEINIELPGVEEEDIDVSVRENVLTVKGEKRFRREERGRSYFFSERAYGAFQRTFRLPPDSDAEKIEAEFRNGLLTVRIAKTGPSAETHRRIDIKRG